MRRPTAPAFAIAVCLSAAAFAQPISAAPRGQAMPQTPPMVAVAQPPQMQASLGGGFIEFLFGDRAPSQPPPPPVFYSSPEQGGAQTYANANPAADPRLEQQPPPGYEMDPQFLPREVDYHGREAPGTIVIDTPNKFLYLVEGGGKAMRYGVGVGRPGFTWAGVHTVSAKSEWPDWTPPDEMLQRRPDLPHFMAGGPDNPLGARALYLGSTLYRIHGSNEPWTIGHAGLVGLHPHAQRGRHRPLRAG